ncbi:MAG: 1-(5-phosphoribosyl)-5-[(5-phosphoribosylamino)methylideneamino]imidazole-4-carboxamide isomerase [Verrucomicrobiae bacterium]|nr:1-(5-phosphoribosyl)-5-[(5-phosphoribosylamino)methylideneamino]imidazole-4-carboxamide isomerase [Verrucomicrobiae bacterium]
MTIYPAIDLKDGNVVRLRQGCADAVTVYGCDPVSVAQRWEREGAEWLHVVDLDGAFTGEPRNWDAVCAILQAVKIPVQFGGGLRSAGQVAEALAMGVARCVIGTRACDRAFVETLVDRFGSKVAVGVDARDGLVTVKGWVEKTAWSAVDFAQQISRVGVRTIIFTDVATDGTLRGPNFGAIAAVCDAVDCDVIASGGVASAADVRQLRELGRANLVGVIIGRALYDGRVVLKEVLCGK